MTHVCCSACNACNACNASLVAVKSFSSLSKFKLVTSSLCAVVLLNSLGGADFEIIPTNSICLLTTCQQAHSKFRFPPRARCSFCGRPARSAMLEAKQPIPWYQDQAGGRAASGGALAPEPPRATRHQPMPTRTSISAEPQNRIFPQKNRVGWQAQPKKIEKKVVLNKNNCPYGLWLTASGARRLRGKAPSLAARPAPRLRG